MHVKLDSKGLPLHLPGDFAAECTFWKMTRKFDRMCWGLGPYGTSLRQASRYPMCYLNSTDNSRVNLNLRTADNTAQQHQDVLDSTIPPKKDKDSMLFANLFFCISVPLARTQGRRELIIPRPHP
jgi:hypothetical protein